MFNRIPLGASLNPREAKGTPSQDDPGPSSVHLCMGYATSMSCISRRPEKIFSPRRRNVPVVCLSALHMRMPALLVIGNWGRSGGPIIQPNGAVRADFRGGESWCNGIRDKEVVYREVRRRKGSEQVDNDTPRVLDRPEEALSALQEFAKLGPQL